MKKLILLILTLAWVVMFSNANAAPVAQFKMFSTPFNLEEDTTLTVKVGEEVVFNAWYSQGLTDIDSSRYLWDFGDGFTQRDSFPTYATRESNNITSHYFMRPDTYTVALWVVDSAGGSDTVTHNVIVVGDYPKVQPLVENPTLNLKFENNLIDSSGNNLNAVCVGASPTYVDGMENKGIRVDSNHYAVPDSLSKIGGDTAFTITCWFQKPNLNTKGTILSKNNVFRIFVDGCDGNQLSCRTVTVILYTSDGTFQRNNYNSDAFTQKQWNYLAVTYDGDSVRLYGNGDLVISGAATGITNSNTDSLLIGKRSTSTEIFSGNIDEIRYYKRSLSKDELMRSFEVWHPNFQGRSKCYLYTQIPSLYTQNEKNKLLLTFTGQNSGVVDTLKYDSSLTEVGTSLINFANYNRDIYTLTAKIIDTLGNVLNEYKDYWYKKYDSLPYRYMINENNAIIKPNKELFFPISPWGLKTTDSTEAISWIKNGYVNTLMGASWIPLSALGWAHTYGDTARKYKCPIIGPTNWNGIPGSMTGGRTKQNIYYDSLLNFTKELINDSVNLAWAFVDEPNLGGLSKHVTAQSVRAWHTIAKSIDTTGMCYTTMVGYITSAANPPYLYSVNKGYYYRTSFFSFGGKKLPFADIIGFDTYPYEYRLTDGVSVAEAINDITYLDSVNAGLLPILTHIETCDVNGRGTESINASQLYHLCWLSIIKGTKGIQWFHRFGVTPEENFQVMKLIVEQTDSLKNVFLGHVNYEFTHSTSDTSKKVHCMGKLSNDTAYIFSARLTEYGETGGVYDTFFVDTTYKSVSVLYEDRSIAVVDGKFVDEYDTNAVHIYKLTTDSTAPQPPTITSISPSSGKIGSQIQLTIDNVTSVDSVYIGTKKVVIDSIVIDSIFTKIPNLPFGRHDVILFTPDGNDTLENGFRVVAHKSDRNVFELYDHSSTPKFKSIYNAIMYLDTGYVSGVDTVWGKYDSLAVEAGVEDSLTAKKGKLNRVSGTTRP